MKQIVRRTALQGLFGLTALTVALTNSQVSAAAPASVQADAQAGEDFVNGQRYYAGDGVPQSYMRAAALYRRAAEKGHRYAQYSLALLYDHGYGVSRDRAEAVHWYRQAAMRGDARAVNRLAMLGEPAPDPTVTYDAPIKRSIRVAPVPAAAPELRDEPSLAPVTLTGAVPAAAPVPEAPVAAEIVAPVVPDDPAASAVLDPYPDPYPDPVTAP